MFRAHLVPLGVGIFRWVYFYFDRPALPPGLLRRGRRVGGQVSGQQLGATLAGQLQRALVAPGGDGGVVPAPQHLGHHVPAEFEGAGVVGVLEEAAGLQAVGLLLRGLLVA
jgi:hypothetical protein